jgi:hypothetical protein
LAASATRKSVFLSLFQRGGQQPLRISQPALMKRLETTLPPRIPQRILAERKSWYGECCDE